MNLCARVFYSLLMGCLACIATLAHSTVIISHPANDKYNAVEHINTFKPHGFTKKPYKMYYRMVPVFAAGPAPGPNMPVDFYPEFLVAFQAASSPDNAYEILQNSRFVDNAGVNLNAENLHIFRKSSSIYDHSYDAKFIEETTSISGWTALPGKVIWGDINGDFITDILVFTEQQNNIWNKVFPSFTLKLEEKYAQTKYGPILTSRTPKIVQKFTKDVLMDHLSNFASVRLKDLNDDGRAELFAKQFSYQGGQMAFATPDASGVFHYISTQMGDPSASNTSDCGVKINGLVYGTDYYTNDTCDRLYFLPPVSGEVAAEQIHLRDSIAMCPQVHSTIAEEHKANNEIASLTEQLFSLVTQQFATAEYQQLLATRNLAEDKLAQLAYLVAIAENKLQYAQSILTQLEDDYSLGLVSEKELEMAEAAVTDAEASRDQASYEHALGVSVYETADGKLETYVQNKANEHNAITQALDELYALNVERRLLVKEIYSLYGGELVYNMRSNWSAHIANVRQKNKNVEVTDWLKMPITSGRVISSLPNNVSEKTGILWTRMLDMENQDVYHSDGRYGPFRDVNVQNVEVRPILDEQISFPGRDTYRGEMGLSLAALCEHYPNGYAATMPEEIRHLPKSLNINLRHNYQYKTESGVRIVYNLGVVAKQIFARFYRQTMPNEHYRDAFYLHHFYHRLPSHRFSGNFHVDKDEIARFIYGLNESAWFGIKFVDPNISLANQEAIRESVKKQLIDNIFTAVTLEYANIHQRKHDIASAILLNSAQLERFVQKNSQWITVDADRDVYITGSRYTNYQ
ncbi:hypothetical protein TDB9533_04471 [Thalassocella blandensis]|nr:hypothetical protein TDB9533_04471 [Thalassocella blandensis]